MLLLALLTFNLPLQGVENAANNDLPYSHPGIVAFREGQWLGSDHLLNLSDHISVFVEVSGPEDMKLPTTTEALKKSVEAVFEKAGITPVAEKIPGKPELPFFHLLVMIYPIKDGYTFSIVASLFEEVKLPRIKLDESVTMQAITWDRQSINIASKDKFAGELTSSVEEMASNFVERYKFFENLKNKQ